MPAAATPSGPRATNGRCAPRRCSPTTMSRWFEEPLRPDALEDYVRLREHSTVADRRRRSADAPPVFQPWLQRARSTSCSRMSPRSAASARSGASPGWRRSTACVHPHGWNTAVGLAADLQLASAFPHRPGRVPAAVPYIDGIVVDPWTLDAEGCWRFRTPPASVSRSRARSWRAIRPTTRARCFYRCGAMGHQRGARRCALSHKGRN